MINFKLEILEIDVPLALRAAKYVEQFPPIREAYEELRRDAEEETEEDEDDLEH